jgi:hypothetical protein
MDTCRDLNEMFPWALSSRGKKKGSDISPIGEYGNPVYIWQFSYDGDMFFGIIRFKFSWTLLYGSLGQAIRLGTTPDPHSEFSIRAYSPGEGLGPWQREGLEYVAELYQRVLRFY